jgi:hypothetical protein
VTIDDWPEPTPADDDWPEPTPADDDWPEPDQSEEPEPVDILDQPAGTPGQLVCGCDAMMVIVSGKHLNTCEES